MDLCHKIWFRYVEQVIVVLDKLLDVLKSLTYMQKLIQKFEKKHASQILVIPYLCSLAPQVYRSKSVCPFRRQGQQSSPQRCD